MDPHPPLKPQPSASGSLGIWRIIADSIGDIARKRADEQLRLQFPDQPWRWRRAWDGRPIEVDQKRELLPLLLGALVWNAAVWPIIGYRVVKGGNEVPEWALLVFGGCGIILAWAAIHRIWLVYKFGVARFVPSNVPGVIGGYVGGVVYFPALLKEATHATVTLRCIKRESSEDSDGSSSTDDAVIWSAADQLAIEHYTQPAQTVVPVLFHVPATCVPTEASHEAKEILWRLNVEAPAAGVDFSASFEIPVFRTGQTAPPPAPGDLGLSNRDPDEKETAALAAAGVRVTKTIRGMKFRLAPSAPLASRIALPVGAAVCAVFALNGGNMLWWLGALVLAAIAADNVLDGTALVVTPEGVTVRRLRPWGVQSVEFPWSDVAECRATEITTGGASDFYRVSLVNKGAAGPREVVIAKVVTGKANADAICGIINARQAARDPHHP